MASLSSDTPFSTPTSSALPPPSSSSSNHSTLRIVATIIPIVIIVAVVMWGLLVAAGFRHQRGGVYPAPSDTGHLHSYRYREKWTEHLEEPKLWDVRTETTEVKPYLEDLHPLSVEVLSDGHKRSKSWRKKGVSLDPPKRKRSWRSWTSVPHPGPSSQEGQVSVFVAMPTPGGRHSGQPMRDFVIGTHPVVYTSGAEEKKKEAQVQERSSEYVEMPIMMDLCTHGFIG
ncbi:hypothetical protein NM688_g5646 [Phlebia brevispora]|uniref:Uncharacterized protein n=1 Tax=Phlebia brevispora TaxID=194682 RepID=A0ACC1SRV4_9APHY|nr:hypothetical protein NM688_g5646 [Phlebia brevispora]